MRCPICKSPVPDPDATKSGTYPFCSERCKLIDLGRWLDGKYQIPVEADEDQNPPSRPSDSHAASEDDDR
jgi:endogenous inhibitor of DNA gyrase (YacG/DUF329 family)